MLFSESDAVGPSKFDNCACCDHHFISDKDAHFGALNDMDVNDSLATLKMGVVVHVGDGAVLEVLVRESSDESQYAVA